MADLQRAPIDELSLGQARIFLVDIRQLTDADCRLVANALPERHAKSLEFLHSEDYLRSVGAGLLLIERLGLQDEAVLTYGAQGKPYAAGLPSFNLSHSGNYVVLALPGGEDPAHELGVDIEVLNPRNLKVAPRVFTVAEQEWLAESPLERFHQLWTQKESIMKLFGKGLQLSPDSFDVTALQWGSVVEVLGKSIEVHSVRIDDCYLSVAQFNDSPT